MVFGGILRFAKSLGNTSIEVKEWQEADVRKLRLPNSPDITKLTKNLPNLAFNGWSLAHAVVKADYLDRRNLMMPGLGFLLQACDLIDFFKSPIELKIGASKALNDVSLTSLAGRVGQGLAILYGHGLGLKFTAHLNSHVNSLPLGSAGVMHKDESMADLLFSNGSQTVLIEAKGSFTLKENDPTAVKRVLKKALSSQVDPWMGYLQPPPSNGYVLYSCLRENSWAPSTLFVVDPGGEEGELADIPFSSEQVMRENYGAWLRAMGLFQAAKRLTRWPDVAIAESPEERPAESQFFVYEYEDREFAIPIQTYGRGYPVWEFPVLGIELSVLMAISNVIQGSDGPLTELLGNLALPLDVQLRSGSIFPDGSVLGSFNQKPVSIQSVRL